MQLKEYIGKKGESLVKKNLWRRNYRVEDVSHLANGSDLLVEGTFRVEVKTTSKDNTPVTLYLDRFDVLCMVFIEKFSVHVFYLKNKEDLQHMVSPTDPNVYYIGAKQIKEYFTKKPQEVFKK